MAALTVNQKTPKHYIREIKRSLERPEDSIMEATTDRAGLAALKKKINRKQ